MKQKNGIVLCIFHEVTFSSNFLAKYCILANQFCLKLNTISNELSVQTKYEDKLVKQLIHFLLQSRDTIK